MISKFSKNKVIIFNKVIFNQLDYVLTNEEKEALTLRLKFNFNPTKLCNTRFYSGFKNLNYQLSKVPVRNCIPDVLNCFKYLYYIKSFNSFRPKLSAHHRRFISSIKN